MILHRVVNANIFAKIRRLDVISTSSLLVRSCSAVPSPRPSSNLAPIKYSTKPTVTEAFDKGLLRKISVNPGLATQQSRAASTQGDHVRLWVFERVVSTALPILIPMALILEKPVLDGILAVLVTVHTHWGLEAVIIDYVRSSIVGPLVPKLALIALNILTATVLAGLLVLIYNGPGISRSIKNAWAIGKKRPDSA